MTNQKTAANRKMSKPGRASFVRRCDFNWHTQLCVGDDDDDCRMSAK